MEDLAVFTALNHSGSFGKNFVKFKKNKYVIYRLRVGPYGKKTVTFQPANNIYFSIEISCKCQQHTARLNGFVSRKA